MNQKKLYRNISQVFLNISILSILILLAGCAMRITPKPSENVYIEKDYAVLDLPDVRIKVRAQHWGYEPQSLSNYFTPFYIEFLNKCDNAITLSRDSFVLIDDNREQYIPVDTEDVSKMFFGYDFKENRYILPNYVIVADSSQLFDMDDKIRRELFYMDEKMKREFEEKIEGYRNIKQKSFQFGKLYPNAIQKGFLFFPEISDDAKALELKYKKHTIYFSIGK